MLKQWEDTLQHVTSNEKQFKIGIIMNYLMCQMMLVRMFYRILEKCPWSYIPRSGKEFATATTATMTDLTCEFISAKWSGNNDKLFIGSGKE